MQDFIGSNLKDEIVISKIYTVHYFEFSKTYKFFGEKHDFWEMVYADKGDVTIFSEDREFVLPQGNVVFHKPNEWHNIFSDGTNAPNVAIVSFECKSPSMTFFEGKTLKVNQEQKSIISKIISEYTNAFSTPLDDPFTNHLVKNKKAPFGSSQMLRQNICEFLISFLRSSNSTSDQKSLVSINQSNSLLNLLLRYMEDNITSSFQISDLIKYSGSNKTTITNLFNKNFGMGPIEYFISTKIDLAKKLLREDNLNVTEIAEFLGYSGIHYFSRQFKKTTGMSPRQYSISIKSLLNK